MLLAITFILIGLALLVVEVYLTPGVNLFGIAGGLCVIAGIVLSFVELGSLGGLAVSVGSISILGTLIYIMWQSGALEHFVLVKNIEHDPETTARLTESRTRYIGMRGTAVTPLRPTGIVEIDGERIEVETEGGFIASGSEVRVLTVTRTRFIVGLADSGD